MAWRFKVAQKTKQPDEGTLTLAVEFYDAADATKTPIVRRDFTFPAYMTTALIQGEIKQEGLKELTRRDATEALAAQIPDNYDAAV